VYTFEPDTKNSGRNATAFFPSESFQFNATFTPPSLRLLTTFPFPNGVIASGYTGFTDSNSGKCTVAALPSLNFQSKDCLLLIGRVGDSTNVEKK
jgi:hypothetical protein